MLAGNATKISLCVFGPDVPLKTLQDGVQVSGPAQSPPPELPLKGKRMDRRVGALGDAIVTPRRKHGDRWCGQDRGPTPPPLLIAMHQTEKVVSQVV